MQWRKFTIGAALGLACVAFFNHEIDAAVSRLKVWSSGETLTASDLNAEFNNVLNNGEDLGWPATKAKDLNAQVLQLDGDADTTITADTDDQIDFALSGTDLFRMDGTATTPVNGLSFVAAAAGSEPSITAFGSDTDVSINLVPKNAGTITISGSAILLNIVEDTTPQLGAQLDVNGNALGDGTLELLAFTETGSAINHINITNAAISNPPIVSAVGDDTDIGIQIRSKGTGDVILADASGEEILIANDAATAVNEITVHNAAAGSGVKIEATGGDTDIDLTLESKGAGDVLLFADTQELLKVVQVASAVNFPQLQPSATGQPVVLAGFGDNTDVGIELQPKGAGTVTVGTEQVLLTKFDTPQATTSGTAFTFTSPFTETVKVEVFFDSVSLTGTDEILVRLAGSAGIETTGYVSKTFVDGALASVTNGFQPPHTQAATDGFTGVMTLSLISPTVEAWNSTGIGGGTTNPNTQTQYGNKTITGALTQVQLTRPGTDTFDGGAVNVRWYGY